MVETKLRTIKIYITRDKKSPFTEWLYSLKDISARAKIRIRLEHIRLGNFGDCKSVGAGVFELRIDWGPGYRIYFGQEEEILVVLLHGGSKTTQPKDIKKAQEYWADYRSRENEN